MTLDGGIGGVGVLEYRRRYCADEGIVHMEVSCIGLCRLRWNVFFGHMALHLFTEVAILLWIVK